MKNPYARGIKGRVKYRVCGHGVLLIDDYRETGKICKSCHPNWDAEDAFFAENTNGFFNHGLGCMTYGTRDAERKAKRMGLTPIGDATIKQVFGRD